MGADPIACAALAAPGGDGLVAFFVRKQRKEHGLQRWVEGPVLEPGDRAASSSRTSSRPAARPCARSSGDRRGPRGRGAVCVVDRLAGGGEAIEAAGGAPFSALTTIDEIYPERPDR